jgi:hypothetical protein
MASTGQRTAVHFTGFAAGSLHVGSGQGVIPPWPAASLSESSGGQGLQ